LLRIAQTLQLPERDAKEQQRVVKAVQGWLYTHRQWLLIWDNVEDLTILDRFLPDTPHGAILLTTRYQTLGTRARGIHLRPMGHEEGMLLLLRRAKVLEAEATGEYLSQLAVQKPSQYTAAADLTTAMGGLPLALDQAGAYLEETQCGLPAYLELFRRRSAALLQLRGDGSRDHPASVSTTFTMAIAAITQRHPAVGELLRVCAFLQPDAIPEEVFLQGAEHLGETLKAVCHDPLDWNQVVAIACSYSLLFRQAEEQTFSLHRLVQAVLLDTMTEEEQERWSKQILCALEHVFPKQEHATWKQCERLLPHVLACLKRAEGSDSTLACASLAYKVALYLNVHGRYPEAEPLFLHALHTREHLLGPDHPHITSPLIDLAVLYLEQGKYAQAEPLLHRALYIREQAFGPDHYQVSSPLNNLALIYQKQGKYAQAEPLLLRSLHIRERTLGPEHPLVANLLNNLAILPWEQGLYTQAEPFFRRALHIWEKALGPDHPQVARALNNLGELSWKVGQPEQAEVLFQRALQIWEQALGSDHPLIAYPLHGLANLYSGQKGDAEVEQLFLRALSIREHHLGPHHPETAQTLHDLALYRKKQGNLDEALALAERALKISLQALGETHLKTVATQALYTQLTQERDHTEPNDASHQRKPTSIPERTSRTPL
jgi:Tfp pilus assembly protein PilF